MVIKKLQTLTGSQAVLHTCATQREPDGLALSSRNLRLSEEERAAAPAIYQALLHIKTALHTRRLRLLKAEAKELLERQGFRVDYVTIADAVTLNETDDRDGKQPLVALVAAYMNEVRLIDNMLLAPEN